MSNLTGDRAAPALSPDDRRTIDQARGLACATSPDELSGWLAEQGIPADGDRETARAGALGAARVLLVDLARIAERKIA